MYVTRRMTLNFPDNVSNMTYSHFLKSGTGLRASYNTLKKISIYFKKGIECLPLYMLLSISYVISKYQYGSY